MHRSLGGGERRAHSSEDHGPVIPSHLLHDPRPCEETTSKKEKA